MSNGTNGKNGNDKPQRCSMEACSYIQDKHPEILKAMPRPGGALRLVNTGLEMNINVRNEGFRIEEKVSREFRVHTAMEEGFYPEDMEEVTLPNPMKDAMYLLSIAISTVMMMAADVSDIPQLHLVVTQQYLKCIRDDFGQHPPNVQGILNDLARRINDANTGPAPGGPTVVTTTRVKIGNQEPDAAEDLGDETGGETDDEAEGPTPTREPL